MPTSLVGWERSEGKAAAETHREHVRLPPPPLSLSSLFLLPLPFLFSSFLVPLFVRPPGFVFVGLVVPRCFACSLEKNNAAAGRISSVALALALGLGLGLGLTSRPLLFAVRQERRRVVSCRVASDFVRRIVRGQERPRSTVGNSQSGFIKEKEDDVFGARTLCVRVSDARELGEPAAAEGRDRRSEKWGERQLEAVVVET